MKYRQDLEYVLKDINLTINPREKIGIVGRTGAGKTSLARSLFQLVDKSICNGSILIDGYGIFSMNRRDVRAKLGIVPQGPTLFSGSYRQNLDPLAKYTVEDMWSAIIKCGIDDLVQPKSERNKTQDDRIIAEGEYDDQLKEIDRWNKKWNSSGWAMRAFLYLFVRKPKLDKSHIRRTQSHDLDRHVKGTLSNGQKQLVGLCRLLMRNRKIIVLDEATASVDQDSDQDMQKLIRSQFKDCTVLTIAHRLKTIMGSDRIVVMDNGRVIEVGPPSELLEKGRYFAELVKANEF
ncbi:ABC transporter C member 13 [Coemansia sp. RSA 1200]|nr:ABC transporter C member 13 [Coemansia sp. RSA 1200]